MAQNLSKNTSMSLCNLAALAIKSIPNVTENCTNLHLIFCHHQVSEIFILIKVMLLVLVLIGQISSIQKVLGTNLRKRALIRNRYNQAPHLTQDTNGKVTHSQLDITNESQEVSPFPAGDHKASTNRRA